MQPTETADDRSTGGEQPPAPDTGVLVRDGGNGDVFLRFGAEQDDLRVELLNQNDAHDLYEKLGKTEAIRNAD